MKKSLLVSLAGIFISSFVSSCADNDFKEISSDVITESSFNASTTTFDVTAENKTMKAIQSSGLSAYQLGEYTQAPFGKTNASVVAQVLLPSNNPVFGEKSQGKETSDNYNENEMVVEATLNIPFFSTKTKQTTNSDGKTETEYQLDSIYGKQNAIFQISVKESNYFLRDMDANFENRMIYYSDFTIDNTLIGSDLATPTMMLLNKNEVIRYQFDNPTTTDKDESKEEDVRQKPRLSVPLDVNFFQSKIIDKEGSSELASNDTFKNYLRGIIIETSNFSDDLMMLLDFSSANIELVYTYKSSVNGTDYTKKKRLELPLKGITVNQIKHQGGSIPTADNEHLYLQGGTQFAEIQLVTDSNVNLMKSENWLINDATLSFEVENPSNIKDIPSRLYLYNAETGEPIADYSLDITSNNNNANNSKLIHLGKYNKDTNRYEIRVTHHLSNIIRKGATNPKLALVVAQNVNQINPISYLKMDGSKGKTSLTTATTPLSVILHGSANSVDFSKRLQLKVTYSKPTN